ncbi:hypothetical protein [Devosia sp.]|uniref:hypothetical protein n=1 Tax=Devosia sp. TaxID=1871048 RepID=UPI00273773CB|nr:hypothetical protein [Devosia sp.]MDP2780753.1 hypothetical protein [Devosia sp.]
MFRSLAVLSVLALGLNPALAQDAPAPAPAAPAVPAATDIVVDPAATLSSAPKQDELLTGFYATMAVIEICALPVPEQIKAGMAGDQKRLEASVGLDEVSAMTAYAKVRADVEATAPDCAEGSPDRASVDAVTAFYAQTDAVPAPGTAAPGAAPAAPAVPAQ